MLTRPDAVRSRGKKLEPSPVKVAALELGLPVLEASRIDADALKALRDAEADVFCVAAYGCILPDEVLTIAPLGCVNVHASLLPRWRGAAPIQRCILEGDDVTGVSIMRIGHGVDTGDYCAQATCSVPGKNADQLTQELANLGGDLLVDTLPKLASHEVAWTVQDEGLVTHAAKISKAELKLDPAASALDNVRRVLASSDTAPARCELAGKGARIARRSLIDMAEWYGAIRPARPAVCSRWSRFRRLRGRRVRGPVRQARWQAPYGCPLLVRRPAQARCCLGFDFLMSDHATTLSPARRLALDILLDVGRRDAFARDVLNANASLKNLEERDAGLRGALCSAYRDVRVPG